MVFDMSDENSNDDVITTAGIPVFGAIVVIAELAIAMILLKRKK